MNKTTFNKIKSICAQLEKSKKKLALERDKIRDFVYDLQAVLDTVEEGHDSIDFALRELNSAVDTLSEQF